MIKNTDKDAVKVMTELKKDLHIFTLESNIKEMKDYYEEKIRFDLIMDDYDGGKVSAYREFVEKLELTERAICGLKQE
jgi:hypothetical protein